MSPFILKALFHVYFILQNSNFSLKSRLIVFTMLHRVYYQFAINTRKSNKFLPLKICSRL